MNFSHHCASALQEIERTPKPSQRFNPGVTRKLVAEGYATHVMLPSPYERSRGNSVGHLQITDKGRTWLEGKK